MDQDAVVSLLRHKQAYHALDTALSKSRHAIGAR